MCNSGILHPTHFTVNTDYVNREELAEIKSAFANTNTRIVVLSGVGGIGKSTLAHQFAVESGGLCQQTVNFAEKNASLEELLESIQFTREVRQRTIGLDHAAQINTHLRYFVNIDAESIVIIDNVDSLRQNFLNELLQQTKCRFLITTRKHVAKSFINRNSNITLIPLEGLNEDSAQEVFEKHYQRKLVKNERGLFQKYIYDYFTGNTLAIVLVAQMLHQQGLSLQEYSANINSALNNNQFTDESANDNVSDTVAKKLFQVFKITNHIDHNPNSDKTRVLRVIKMGINIWFSENFLQNECNLKNANVFVQLEKDGIINRKEEQDGYYVSLHPIVGRVLTMYGIKANNESRNIILNWLNARESESIY